MDTHGQPGKSLGEWLAGTAGTANEGTRAVWLAMGSAPQSGGHAQEPVRVQVSALQVPLRQLCSSHLSPRARQVFVRCLGRLASAQPHPHASV